MKIAAQRLNKGVQVSKKALNKMNAKYIGLYHRTCYKLYDMGYITTPSVFDEFEFRTILFSEYPDVVGAFRSLDGKIDMSWRHIDLYLCKCKDEDLGYILSLYADIQRSLEALGVVKSFMEHARFAKTADLKSVKPRYSVMSGVSSASVCNFNSVFALEALYRPEGCYVSNVSMCDIRKDMLCEYLGISDDKVNEYRKAGRALFLKGYSFEQETDFIDLLLDEKLMPTGDFGTLFIDRVTKYYSDFSESNTCHVQCIPFREVLAVECVDRLVKRVSDYRASNDIESEFFMTVNDVYFLVHGDVLDSRLVIDSIGAYALDWYNKCELSGVNMMFGLSGEYISVKAADKLGYTSEIHPVELYVNDSGALRKELFYPIMGVCDADGHKLQPLVGYEVNFTYTGYKRKDINNLHDYLVDKYDFSKTDYTYKDAVSELVSARVCLECDTVRDGCGRHTIGLTHKVAVNEDIAVEAEHMWGLVIA